MMKIAVMNIAGERTEDTNVVPYYFHELLALQLLFAVKYIFRVP
jgi:hypothetical protein